MDPKHCTSVSATFYFPGPPDYSCCYGYHSVSAVRIHLSDLESRCLTKTWKAVAPQFSIWSLCADADHTELWQVIRHRYKRKKNACSLSSVINVKRKNMFIELHDLFPGTVCIHMWAEKRGVGWEESVKLCVDAGKSNAQQQRFTSFITQPVVKLWKSSAAGSRGPKLSSAMLPAHCRVLQHPERGISHTNWCCPPFSMLSTPPE